MDKPLVSVIIPMHNSELLISNVLDSVVTQTYQNLEIIVVDDKSTDKGLDIVRTYCDKYSRVRVVALTQNVGVGGARNEGIKKAQGDYIAWLDSDDIYNIYFIETLMNIALDYNCDVVECQPIVFSNDSEIDNKVKPEITDIKFGDGSEIIRRFASKELQTSLWSKLFRATIFDNFEFPIGEIYEEPYFYFKKYQEFRKVAFIKNQLYFYRNTPNSIMKSFSDETIISNLRLQDFILNHIQGHCPYHQDVSNRVLCSLIVTLQRANYLNVNKETIRLVNDQIDKTLACSHSRLNLSLKNRIILFCRKSMIFWSILKQVNKLR